MSCCEIGSVGLFVELDEVEGCALGVCGDGDLADGDFERIAVERAAELFELDS